MIGGEDGYALVTGASSGFGSEYARMLACAAYRRRFLYMDADKAARLGYRALANGRTCSIAGLQPNLVAFFMTRFLPRSAAIEINTALSQPA